MDQKDREIVRTAIQEHGDDFWNDDKEGTYTGKPNREGIIDELIEMLKQAGYKFVVKPL